MSPLTEPSDEALKAAVARAVGVDEHAVRVETTHLSRVFITAELVFKFKRWLDLGFVDHRSLDARQAHVRDEVVLNARLAPAVYLGVAALRTMDEHPCAAAAGDLGASSLLQLDWPPSGTSGRVIDWCVVMRALPAEWMLNRLLDEGRVDRRVEAELELLARHLARFHRTAPRGGDLASLRTPERVRLALSKTLAALASWEPRTAEADLAEAQVPEAHVVTAQVAEAGAAKAPVEEATNCSSGDTTTLIEFVSRRALIMLDDIMPLLESRRARGCVVDGHGDLHSRNICMVPGAPTAFDCIDFSRELRVRDTSAEMAFLAMDLDAHGRADLAERVTHAYLDEVARDPQDADHERDFLVPQTWYRLHDALVRAMVERMRGAKGESLRFLHLAVGYALPPSLVLMCGLPGSGKSTVARGLAGPLRAVVLRSDEHRKQQAGLPPTARGDASLYEASVTTRVYSELLTMAAEAIRCGRHVIVDAAFPTAELRAMARETVSMLSAATAGSAVERRQKRAPGAHDRAPASATATVPWIVVECVAPLMELRRRLEHRVHDAQEVSDADVAVMQSMAARFESPGEIDARRRVRVESASPMERVRTVVLERLMEGLIM
ncbi:MAG: AAA family ATPase [Phycisphaeraceae bacterium]|nr:AAA family ATPase [Phycisphaeraceae bacterium]